jgi:antitoxin YokJ
VSSGWPRGGEDWDIAALLDAACTREDARVLPPSGVPSTPAQLPEDLAEFYGGCGGVRFVGWAPEIAIVGPERLVRADPVILGEDSGDPLPRRCYVIAESDEGATAQRITIDLDPTRLGRCYYSFWDSYPSRGSMGIVAFSFAELLGRLLEFEGEDGERFPYWLAADFAPVADAYDDLG